MKNRTEIQELLEKRNSLFAKVNSTLDAALKDKRALTADELSSNAKIEAEAEALDKTIQAANIIEARNAKLASERDADFKPEVKSEKSDGKRNRKVDSAAYKAALDVYARRGLNGIESEFRAALQVGTTTEGGYIVPTEFETSLVELLVNMDPIRALAHKITTASDRNIPIETSKGTFDYISEESAYGASSDPAFGQVVLSAFKSGGIIKVSEELLQDAFFDLPSYLVRVAADRFNALEETNFAAGNGTGKPKGIFATTLVGGVTVPNTNGGSTSAITFDNLVDVFHALGRPYRQNSTWVMGDATAKYLRKIKTGISGDTTYVWQPAVVAGQPDTILGRPVVITGGAPAMGSANVPIIIADLSKYYIADRLGTSMQRLNELYAANGQVGFRFTRRNDGRLVDALAVSTLTMST